MMMKIKLYFLLFLFIQLFLNAQVIQLSYDRVLQYSIKEDNNFNIYNSKSEIGNLIVGFGENWDTSYYKNFSWQYKKTVLNGNLLNNKFLYQNGSSGEGNLLEVTWAKDSNLYDIDSYKNCIAYKMSFKENKTGSYFMIYCKEADDRYNYTEMNKFLFANQLGTNIGNLPENNIVVKVMLFDKNNNVLDNLLDLIKVSYSSLPLYFNKEYVEAYINEKEYPKDKKTAPYYCQFIVEEAYLTDELEKRLNQFMNDMDIYYNQFGYLNIHDQNNFYDSEIDRLSKFYLRHNHLNSKQAQDFKFILKKLKTSKNEEDFFWVRDAY